MTDTTRVMVGFKCRMKINTCKTIILCFIMVSEELKENEGRVNVIDELKKNEMNLIIIV